MINLTLHVVEAKNLINTGSVRVSDPYCKITVNNETKKSRAVHNTTNPRWDYRFYFQNVPLDAPIAIEVFDKNLIRSHSFMGRMYVSVNQLRQQSKGWWPLYSREGEGNLGSIYLQADFIELQRVLHNEMQYRYVNVPPQQGLVGQQAQVIPQGQVTVNQQLPTQSFGNTAPIVVGQGLPPQVITLPSQGQIYTGQTVSQVPTTYVCDRESCSSESSDSERESNYIPPQGYTGQQYPIQSQVVSGQQYPTQSGVTQSTLPQTQGFSGQGLSGQGLSGQQYPIQSGVTQSTLPQTQGLSGQGLSGQGLSGQRSFGNNIPQTQGLTGQGLTGQGLSGQQYPTQSGVTQSSLPQTQGLSGQRSFVNNIPQTQGLSGQGISGQGLSGQGLSGQGLTGQGLSGQQYPTQSGVNQSSLPQTHGLTQTPVNYSNQNENYKTESPYFERNNSRDFSDDTSTPDLSNKESRKHTNRSIDSPLLVGTTHSSTNTSGLSGNQGNKEFNYIDFSLHVVEARNLHNTGTIRSSDPFLEISVAEESTKTKTVTNTVNPRWDETFSFKDVPSNAKILFQVIDRNLITSNQVMGRFETDVNALRERPSNWWTLYGPEGESTSGEVYIDCYFN